MDRLNVTVDWTAPDRGYSSMMKPRVKKYLTRCNRKNKNLIHTAKPFRVNKKGVLHLSSKRYTKWPQSNQWKTIKCKSYSKWIKATPCKIGNKNKIFLKLKPTRKNKFSAGFSQYLNALHKNKITKSQHIEFVDTMSNIFGDNPIRNHNEDVDIFHVKDV